MSVPEIPELRYSKFKDNRTDPRTARKLIYTHYTNLLGAQVRYETPRSLRLKIIEVERSLRSLQVRNKPLVFQSLAQYCVQLERLCYLHEILGH